MYLSVDFGGTRSRAGWFSSGLDLLARAEIDSAVERGPDAVITDLITLAKRVVPAGERPDAIGIAGPGPQAYTGRILHAATLPGWHDVPLAERISQGFDNVPTFLENDANVAALAEYQFGAAQGADPALYLTVSTGIGGGAILGGRLFTGWRGLAIEPGHLQFKAADGTVRSLEALASGTGIGRLARERLARSHESSVLRTLERVDGRVVGEAALGGDALARVVVEEAGRWLGLGLVALVHLFNPQAIVLGGSVIKLGELFLGPARETLSERLIDPLFNDPALIRVAALGEDAPLVGAAIHAREKRAADRPGADRGS